MTAELAQRILVQILEFLAQRILAQTFELYETEALLKAITYGEQGNNFHLGGSVATLSSDGKLCG